jgi:hypothetical protein
MALRRFGMPVWPLADHIDGSPGFPLATFLKNLKLKAKAEAEKLAQSSKFAPSQAIAAAVPRPSLEDELGSSSMDSQACGSFVAQSVLDIPRSNLAHVIALLREKVFFDTAVDESLHMVPIDQMGDYQEALNRRQFLRPIDEEKAARSRRPLFGNPFKKMFVDEADSMAVDGVKGGDSGKRIASPSSPCSPKRKRPTTTTQQQQQQPTAKAPKREPAMEGNEANNSIRLSLYREVRRPNWSPHDSACLPTLLGQLRGDVSTRRTTLIDLIEQANQFGSAGVLAILESALAQLLPST